MLSAVQDIGTERYYPCLFKRLLGQGIEANADEFAGLRPEGDFPILR